jgi:benzoyl-CoA reductase/2-hydroxyglutaryl-CoA dehydratase subunit BcrC/BadD/HgdB
MSKAFQQFATDLDDIQMTDTFAITKKFKTDVEFSQHIEQTAMKNGDSLIDTILSYCDTHDIDEELIAKLLSQSLKDKIMVEAQDLKLMSNLSGTLDI